MAITKTDSAHHAYQLTPFSRFGYSDHAPVKPARAPPKLKPTEAMISLLTSFAPALAIVLQIVALAALADFVAGVIHWAEDAYFTEDTPIIGPLFIRPNIVHHHVPRFFTRLTWWQSSWDLAIVGALVLLGAWPLGFLSWQLGLFVALSINANEIHKWSHRTRAENGPVISALQAWHILQTPRHHALHHSDPKNTYYCPITNFVNPVLERLEFWTHLESVIERLTGLTHRPDTAVRGQGPGPAWLSEFKPASALQATPCTCATCRFHRHGNCARHVQSIQAIRPAA